MECHLHLGAHRTGTTATQKLLESRPMLLREAGVACLGPTLLRGWGMYGTIQTMLEGRESPDQVQATRAVLSDYLAEVHWARRIVVSDENLTGSMLPGYEAGLPYPDVFDRLSAAARILPLEPDLVCFTIRDLAGYWQSVFAHLATRKRVGDFEANRLARSAGTSWIPVLQGVRAAFPKARLMVFGYDEAIVPRLVSVLVGKELATELPEAKRTFGLALSETSNARLEAVPKGAERDRLSLDLRADRDTPDRTFSSDQARHLARAYAQDWAELQAGAVKGALLDPGQAVVMA